MKEVKRFSCLLIVLATLFVSCSSTVASQSQSSTPESSLAGPFANNAGSKIVSVNTSNEQGFYDCESFWPNSCSLLYLDYASKQQVFLCARPNCAHNSEDCNSYIPLSADEVPPVVVTAGDFIILLRTGPSGDQLAGVKILDSDGSNPRDLFQLPANQTMSGQLYFDGEWLYYDVMETVIENDEPITKATLQRSNVQSGLTQEVLTFPQGTWLFSCAGDCLVVDRFTDEYHSFYYLHPSSEHSDAFIDDTPFFSAPYNTIGAFVREGKVYTYSYPDNLASCLDLETGKTTTIDCSVCVDGKELLNRPSISCLNAPNLMRLEYTEVTAEGTNERAIFLLNLETGEISPRFTLSSNETGKTISLKGALGDTYFVFTGYTQRNIPVDTQDGPIMAELAIAQYATIAKDDFFNSRSNFSPVSGLETLW